MRIYVCMFINVCVCVCVCAVCCNINKSCILALSVCVFQMIHTINSDYFPKQHYPVGPNNGDGVYFL